MVPCPTWRVTAAPSPSTACAWSSGCRGCPPRKPHSTGCLGSASTAPSQSPSRPAHSAGTWWLCWRRG
eukprot:scaffold8988_cov112-Isochrysis_galbana.AAC.1